MDSYEYWRKQTAAQPLFPELQWSRPENKQFAGKLLVVGGNAHGFAAPAQAYNLALKAGIGTARVLLPSALQKTVGPVLEAGEFAPSNPSGSFSSKALAELLDMANWADGVLLAGDLGRNSETAIVLEQFLTKSRAAVTLTKDAIDYATTTPRTVLQRPGTVLVLSLAQLQRLATAAKFEQPIMFSMDLLRLVTWLHQYTLRIAPYIIVKHLDNILVAGEGQVTSTKLEKDVEVWRVQVAAYASVWWAQNPDKPLAALTTAIHEALK